MTKNTVPLKSMPEWKALESHFSKISGTHLRGLFAADPGRADTMTADALGLYFDYSKHRATAETIKLLVALAEASGLRASIEAMFSGEKINLTENRAVLHTALRAPKSRAVLVDGADVIPQVHAVLDKMESFARKVRGGEWKGHTGRAIKNIVNIGIGGSDLGPVMAYEALKNYSRRGLTFRFVSNVDGTDFAEAVIDLDPEETLFIVASKTPGVFNLGGDLELFARCVTGKDGTTLRKYAVECISNQFSHYRIEIAFKRDGA